MSAWIQITNDLVLLAIEDRLWLRRVNLSEACSENTSLGKDAGSRGDGSGATVELILPPPKPGPLRRNIGNENKEENEKGTAIEETSSQAEMMEVSDADDSAKAKSNSSGPKEPVRLTSVHLPPCQTYVLACTTDKRLVVWIRQDNGGDQNIGDKWRLHSVRDTPRKCVQVRVTGQVPPMVLVADRAGDVYEFDLENIKMPPHLLMGRMSMLLDMVLSPSDNFVVVCDRDEKIVVCHYPQAYNIITFCLGHRQFITSIELLPNNPSRLVSVGGDGKLILWDLKAGGVQIASADCWAEAQTVDQLLPFEQFHSRKNDQDVRPPLKKVLCQGNLIAVVYCRVPYVHVFRYDGNSLTSCGGVVTEAAVWSAAIDDACRLWVLTPSVNVFQLDENGKHHAVELPVDLSSAMHEALKPLEGVTEVDPDLDILYKQWFDNVEEYFERKRQREKLKTHKKQKRNEVEKPQTEASAEESLDNAVDGLKDSISS